MYSMLLMSAMATGPDTVEFNGFFRRLFTLGGEAGSCTGSQSKAKAGSGCTGSKSGCYGSGSGRTSAGAGSCTGRAYSSCSGSGYSSCCGGSGSRAGAMTAPYTSTPMPAVVYTYAPPSNCCGGGGYGYTYPPATSQPPTYIEPPPAGSVPFAQPREATPPATIPETQGRYLLQAAYYTPATADRATVTVRLPADAVLYAEGRRLNLSGDTRAFVTPPLPPGEYGYTFRAEYVRNGELLSRTRQVAVRAGASAMVEFAEFDLASRSAPSGTPATAVPAASPTPTPTPTPVPSVPPPPAGNGASGSLVVKAPAPIPPTPVSATPAGRTGSPAPPADAKAARITVKLPPGAVLYVDGRRNDRTESVRRFDTPPVPAGQAFTYTVRVDMPQGNGPVAQSEAVTVRGGEEREVDFTRPLPASAERAGR